MTDSPDYWCHVALDYLGECAYIVYASDDCADDGLLDDPDIFDIVGMDWAKGQGPGLYRLTLSFDMDAGDVLVSASELLVGFPPLRSAGLDYLKITKAVLHDQP